MTNTATDPRVAFTNLALASLPDGHVRASAEDLAGREDTGLNLVVGMASEFLNPQRSVLPAWVDSETRYLVVVDVATQAIVRLPAALGLHKPHLRLHVSPDQGMVKRLVLAQARKQPWEGIVDAYALANCLTVVHGDLTVREFPQERLPRVRRLKPDAFQAFEIDTSGSFLYWADLDTHLGASQLLQAVDPMYLADVEVERYAREKVSLVLLDMREERGLKQTEIAGLSDRHVRRLENEEARLTVEAAESFARAFGMGLSDFLTELGTRLAAFDELARPDSSAEAGAG